MFYSSTAIMTTPSACVIEVTPPTFAGIAALAVQGNGSLLASWLAATDITPPISYDVYIQKDTATGLFGSGNKLFSTEDLSALIFQDALGNLLQAGDTYYVGVRAKDGVGNQDSNLVSLFGISTGVLSNSLGDVAAALQAALLNTGGIDGEVDDGEDLTGEVDNC